MESDYGFNGTVPMVLKSATFRAIWATVALWLGVTLWPAELLDIPFSQMNLMLLLKGCGAAFFIAFSVQSAFIALLLLFVLAYGIAEWFRTGIGELRKPQAQRDIEERDEIRRSKGY